MDADELHLSWTRIAVDSKTGAGAHIVPSSGSENDANTMYAESLDRDSCGTSQELLLPQTTKSPLSGFSSKRRNAGYFAVRTILGLVLIAAAVLKGHALATGSAIEQGLSWSAWLQIVLVTFETVLGLLLISGLCSRYVWQVALLFFCGLSSASLYQAFAGRSSCSCFGDVDISPWSTFVFDIGAVAVLFWFRPRDDSPSRFQIQVGDSRLPLVQVTMIALVVAAPTAVSTYQYGKGHTERVTAQPSEWIGKPFSLLNDIDVRKTISTGSWIILLHTPSCGDCRDAVARYQQLPFAFAGNPDAPRIAFVEIAPYAEDAAAVSSRVTVGRLSENNSWNVGTPTALLMEDGIVRAVFKDPMDVGFYINVWGTSASSVQAELTKNK